LIKNTISVATAVGIGAGIIALIVIIIVVVLIATAIGGRFGYAYYAKHRANMNDVQSNPMYKDNANQGNNPFYESEMKDKN